MAKITPELDGAYPSSLIPYLFIFKNPIFEEFITYYMGETQSLIEESIKFEQFQLINWKNGVP
jgi:hypothetical protein